MKKEKKLTIIVGCGQLGANLANQLSEASSDVIIIDRKQDAFDKLSSSFAGLTLLGDGCDLDLLKQANIEEASCLVAVTEFDNNNILIAQAAKKMFGVEKVIIKLNNYDCQPLVDEDGIKIICPTDLSYKGLINLMGKTGE